MPLLLVESEIDDVQEQVDADLTAAEEAVATAALRVATDERIDLSEGGAIGAVEVQKGRAAARRAWTWDGAETTLPLAWNPEGTRHNGARHYLLKRHCKCCNLSGFHGIQCPACAKNGCPTCRSSTVRGNIIPCFYLREEDVPFPTAIYGDVDCFLETCTRRGALGFRTASSMRMHGRLRHKIEYQGYLEDQRAGPGVQALERLEQRLADLEEREARLLAQAEAEELRKEANKVRMTKARTARGKKKS